MPCHGRGLRAWAGEIGTALAESAAAHSIADVEVGCFLSGGVDSSLVAREMARRQPAVQCFSVGYAEAAYSELPAARAAAAALGVPQDLTGSRMDKRCDFRNGFHGMVSFLPGAYFSARESCPGLISLYQRKTRERQGETCARQASPLWERRNGWVCFLRRSGTPLFRPTYDRECEVTRWQKKRTSRQQ